jgi:hypothetical protein
MKTVKSTSILTFLFLLPLFLHAQEFAPVGATWHVSTYASFGNFNTMESETVFLDAIPNPAKSRTVFHYRLPETIEVAQIIVTSMDGRTIKMIDVEGTFGQVEWDTKGVTEGIYIYRLITGNEAIETKRLVIIK